VVNRLLTNRVVRWSLGGTLATFAWAVTLASLLLAAPTPSPEGMNRTAPIEKGGRSRASVYAQVEGMTVLGRKLFQEPALSASGKMSCASCHDPDLAFGPENALAVQVGGAKLTLPGLRAVPSLTYLQDVPPFAEHFFDEGTTGYDGLDQGPTGGLTWDGRVDRSRDQARIPLLSPVEMANLSPAQVVAAARRAGYGEELKRVFGDEILENDRVAFAAILEALETYQQSPGEFYPYSSKYDAFLAGKAKLTAPEQQGLRLFEDPAKGNCASCHPSSVGADGTPPQFTDYGLIALGVPRNPAIPANADPAFYDLGLCGPERQDLRGHPEYCGRFRTPSLRNVATRHVFFHNGKFTSLQTVVEFYVQRDTSPGRWYPRNPDGTVRKFDDLPAADRANVNMDPPFGGNPGAAPALTTAEARDVVAFLQTLTDAPVDPATLARAARGPGWWSGLPEGEHEKPRPSDPAKTGHGGPEPEMKNRDPAFLHHDPSP
jgi:cytochrome c peroxidase